jgi:hypothetical protein
VKNAKLLLGERIIEAEKTHVQRFKGRRIKLIRKNPAARVCVWVVTLTWQKELKARLSCFKQYSGVYLTFP